MICQRIGLPPISTIGFGLVEVSSDSRVPRPPASITAFTEGSIPCQPPGDNSKNAFRAPQSPLWRAPPIGPVAVDVYDRLSDPMDVTKVVHGLTARVLGKSIVIDDHKSAGGQLRVERLQGI